uniref:15 kDa selenoprotein-like n=1 Tax=Rhizophora mucronata TaxID=61149 RepID=A0A2P2KE12_RHIMU
MGVFNLKLYKGALLLVIFAVGAILPMPNVSSSKEQLSSRECEDLGFTGLALCSDCHTFSEYVKSQGYSIHLLFFLSASFPFFT